MSDYSIDSTAFTRDNWSAVWPVGQGLGTAQHLRSWPDYQSLKKFNEFFEGAGRLPKIRKGAAVQEDLLRRYTVIQQHVWELALEGMVPAARLSSVPPGTEFTKDTVRADYIVVATAQARPSIDRSAAAEQAQQDLLAWPGGRLAGISDTTVAGDPAVVAAGAATGPDGFVAERRAVVIYPADRGVVGRLILHTDFGDAATRIDEVLADVLPGTAITENEQRGSSL